MTRTLPQTPTLRGPSYPETLYGMLRQPEQFWLGNVEKYGEIYRLPIGLDGKKIVAVNHPRHAQHLFRDKARQYEKEGSFWTVFRELLGNGVAVSVGDFWLRQRRMIQPFFHRHNLLQMTEPIDRAINVSLAPWEQAANTGQPINVVPQFKTMLMNIVIHAIFGGSLPPERLAVMGQDVSIILSTLLTRVIFRYFRYLPDTYWGEKTVQGALTRMDAAIQEVIVQHRRDGDKEADLLAMLVHAVDDVTNERMTDRQLRDEVLTMLLAATDTTALSMAWTIDLLTHHPYALNKLQEEVDEIVGQRTPTAEDVGKLAYNRLVLQESLRIRPPVWFNLRRAMADDEIDGMAIEEGTTIMLLMYVLHHRPDYWDDPFAFYPERFDVPFPPKHGLAWLPFITGPRQCIGRDLVTIENALMITKILQRYKISAVSSQMAPFKMRLELQPAPIMIKVEHRPEWQAAQGKASNG